VRDTAPLPAGVIPLPSPDAIARRAAELLAEARANPAICITDDAKAAVYFESRAIAELKREGRGGRIMRPAPRPAGVSSG
jgi:hypothetical protein